MANIKKRNKRKPIDQTIDINPLPKQVIPRTKNQTLLLEKINNNLITFVNGFAGCGKTHMAIGTAVEHLYKGLISKIVLTRPIVEVGETLGYLPGDISSKLHPYLIPLYDELEYFCPNEEVEEFIERGTIEILPLNFMRGRTLKNSFIILDEMQNCTYEQLRMALTRFGEGSKMVINGDVSQSDLPKHKQGGLLEFMNKLEGLDLIGIVTLGKEDIVRHEIVGRIIERLDNQSIP